MVFSDKLQLLRKKNGLSQEQLASQLTVSRQAVSKWEVGDSMPDAENIVQISKLFDVSTDYLLLDEIDNDLEIPGVQKSVNRVKVELRNKILKWTSFSMIGTGTIGFLALWIASWLKAAYIFTTEDGRPPAPVPYDEMLDMSYYPEVEIRGSIVSFVYYYRIEILFWLCCVLILAGLLFLGVWFLFRKRIIRIEKL